MRESILWLVNHSVYYIIWVCVCVKIIVIVLKMLFLYRIKFESLKGPSKFITFASKSHFYGAQSNQITHHSITQEHNFQLPLKFEW